ncbi:MAG: aldehyde dehydrogenase, partial [Rhodobacteraceae bacterium]|nr:aldehyde dehydrogenase [Paracoccaceae bacterium]
PAEHHGVRPLHLVGQLGQHVTTAANVSVDFNHDPRSSVVALDQTRVMEGTMVRILSWYDNEWGFSNRMLDTAAKIGSLD